jgi:hypothetical protein
MLVVMNLLVKTLAMAGNRDLHPTPPPTCPTLQTHNNQLTQPSRCRTSNIRLPPIKLQWRVRRGKGKKNNNRTDASAEVAPDGTTEGTDQADIMQENSAQNQQDVTMSIDPPSEPEKELDLDAVRAAMAQINTQILQLVALVQQVQATSESAIVSRLLGFRLTHWLISTQRSHEFITSELRTSLVVLRDAIPDTVPDTIPTKLVLLKKMHEAILLIDEVDMLVGSWDNSWAAAKHRLTYMAGDFESLGF